MKLRFVLALAGTFLFLFSSVSAASISLADITGMPGDEFIALPELPPPTDGSVLQRKILDTQPFVYKTSDRLLREAEISRNAGTKKWNEGLETYRQELEKSGQHYSLETLKKNYLSSPDPRLTPEMIEAMEDFNYANQKYDAAMKATSDKDYDRKARIFESAAEMYGSVGATKAQEQVENAALAARAQAAAEKISLPLPAWIAVVGIAGGLFMIHRRKK
jgi:hypothetical protein